MVNYIVYGPATGEIHRYGSCADDMVAAQAFDGLLATESDAKPETHYVSNGDVVAYSSNEAQAKAVRPLHYAIWSNQTMQWEDQRTLEQVKRAADQRVNAARLQANQTSFTYLGKEIAADPLSRSDIDAINGEVANTGAFPAGWPGGWKCIDNTYVAITTVDDWKAFYTAMVNQGTANFAHAQTLKAQIASATTIAEVEAVQW